MQPQPLLHLWQAGITIYGHLVVLQSPENQTIPLLISNLGSVIHLIMVIIMTAIVIATLPTALVFFLMQRHFVAGMMGQ